MDSMLAPAAKLREYISTTAVSEGWGKGALNRCKSSDMEVPTREV